MEQTVPTLLSNLITMAHTVSGDAMSAVVAIIPQLAPIVGAGIVARLGFRYVRRYSH